MVIQSLLPKLRSNTIVSSLRRVTPMMIVSPVKLITTASSRLFANENSATLLKRAFGQWSSWRSWKT
jgi:hypothetical protein